MEQTVNIEKFWRIIKKRKFAIAVWGDNKKIQKILKQAKNKKISKV